MKLSDAEHRLLAEFARQLITEFSSFTLEDVVRYGQMKTQTLNRIKLTEWFYGECLPFFKAKGWVVEQLAAYDYPIWIVTPSQKVVSQS